MDLLKAELERKRRAVADASNKGSGHNGKRKKYLTAAERRRLEEEEEEREEELRREKRRRRKKRSRRGDDTNDEDDGKMEEDLTTLLTKRCNPAEKKANIEAAAGGVAGSIGEAQEESDGAKDHAAGDTKQNPSKEGNPSGDSIKSSIPASLRNLSPEEVTNALRGHGLPIRLFGEKTTTVDGGGCDDSARLQRLSIAMKGREAAMLGESERDEFLLESANRTRNVFLEKDAHNDAFPAKTSKNSSDGDRTVAIPAALTKEELNDKPKRIYRYFKSLVRQWEDDLAHRSDADRRTAAGKNETKTLKQCKDYIRPLFQLCKRRELADDLQTHLFCIVTNCEQGEFVKAHDSYMDVAIGRAAWPIGVTMVGIHARSGRAKIESSNVAHIMNSESQRKYLTSVKRLMSYAQRKRPDVHPSKKVMNL